MTDDAAIVRPARRDQLPALLAFVAQACDRASLAAEDAWAVRLAAEEACSNVIDHAYASRADGGPVTIRLTSDGARATITISDEAPAFDPASLPAPDLAAPLDARHPGGLGWHLIRQVMDEVRHEHGTDGNTLTLVRRLGPAGAAGRPAAPHAPDPE